MSWRARYDRLNRGVPTFIQWAFASFGFLLFMAGGWAFLRLDSQEKTVVAPALAFIVGYCCLFMADRVAHARLERTEERGGL